MVPIYDDDQTILGEIEENTDLDYWDGHNRCNGGVGIHRGLALWNDEYVLIHSSQHSGSHSHAEIISAENAVQEILRSGEVELFDEFPGLNRKELNPKTKPTFLSFNSRP